MQLQKRDVIWRNAKIATMNPCIANPYGLLQGHDLIVRDDKILALLPQNTFEEGDCLVVDAKNALITPGLIDCHTHLVFAGNRACEWEERLNGTPYVEIAKQGGGINATVRSTRAASAAELFDLASNRLKALVQEGVTTVEAKSGYGLSLEHESKQLDVVKKLGQTYPIEMVPTLLSAHAVPPEFVGRSDEYVDEVCHRIMPALWQQGLFEAVDVFCENVGFSLEQTKKIFQAAAALGIPVKGHTEQLSNLGGSALVAQFDGLSVDHIEYLDEASVLALKNVRTVATLLPLAYYFLKESKTPPIDLLRLHGIPMAISTDFNPGTSPFASLRLAMNMACVEFGLTPEEVLAGVTIHAAQALGREATHGQIDVGFYADFVLWNVVYPVEIFYELGHNPIQKRVFRGQVSDLTLWRNA